LTIKLTLQEKNSKDSVDVDGVVNEDSRSTDVGGGIETIHSRDHPGTSKLFESPAMDTYIGPGVMEAPLVDLYFWMLASHSLDRSSASSKSCWAFLYLARLMAAISSASSICFL